MRMHFVSLSCPCSFCRAIRPQLLHAMNVAANDNSRDSVISRDKAEIQPRTVAATAS